MTVLRVRLVAIAFLAVFVLGLGYMPAVFAWTFLAGDTATARVTECRHGKHVTCFGHWQDADGRRDGGHISGADDDDVGHDVEVRLGPLGTYAGGPAGSWAMLLPLIPLLLAPPFVIAFKRRVLRPGQAVARRLLAEPPDGATLLSVPHTWANGAVGVTDPDGGPRLSLSGIEAPPTFRPMELPGRRPRRRPTSAFTNAAGLTRSATSFAAVSDPGGSPVFVLEGRGSADWEPETWLLDTGWTPQAVIRRVEWFPARFELLGTGGEPLGTIAPPEGLRSGAFAIRDRDGRQVAVIAAYSRRWIVRVEPGVPPLLRDLTLAFALDAARLQM